MEDIVSFRVWESDRAAGIARIGAALDPLIGVRRPGHVPLLGWRYVDKRSSFQGEIHLDIGAARPMPTLSSWELALSTAHKVLALAVKLEADGLDMAKMRGLPFFLLEGEPAFSEAHYLLGSRSWFIDERVQDWFPGKMAGVLSWLLWSSWSWNEVEWVARRDSVLPRQGENRAGFVVGRLSQGYYKTLEQAWQEWNSREETPESLLVTRWGKPLCEFEANRPGRFRRELPLDSTPQLGQHPSWPLRGWVLLRRAETWQLDWEMEGEATLLQANTPQMAEALLQCLIEWEQDGLEVARIRPGYLFVQQGKPCLCLPLMQLEDVKDWPKSLLAPSPYREVARLLSWVISGQDFGWGDVAGRLGEQHPLVTFLQRLAPADGKVSWRSLREAYQSSDGTSPAPPKLIQRLRPTCHPRLNEFLDKLEIERSWCLDSRVHWREWIEPNGKYCELPERGSPIPMRPLTHLLELAGELGCWGPLAQAEPLKDAELAIPLLEQAAGLACPSLPELQVQVFDLKSQGMVAYDPRLSGGALPRYCRRLGLRNYPAVKIPDWLRSGIFQERSWTYGLLLHDRSGPTDWELAWALQAHTGQRLPLWDGQTPLLLLFVDSGWHLNYEIVVWALKTANHHYHYGIEDESQGFQLSWGQTCHQGQPPPGFWELLHKEDAFQRWQGREWSGDGEEWVLRVSYQDQRLHCRGRGCAPSELISFADLFPLSTCL